MSIADKRTDSSRQAPQSELSRPTDALKALAHLLARAAVRESLHRPDLSLSVRPTPFSINVEIAHE